MLNAKSLITAALLCLGGVVSTQSDSIQYWVGPNSDGYVKIGYPFQLSSLNSILSSSGDLTGTIVYLWDAENQNWTTSQWAEWDVEYYPNLAIDAGDALLLRVGTNWATNASITITGTPYPTNSATIYRTLYSGFNLLAGSGDHFSSVAEEGITPGIGDTVQASNHPSFSGSPY